MKRRSCRTWNKTTNKCEIDIGLCLDSCSYYERRDHSKRRDAKRRKKLLNKYGRDNA